MSAESTPRDPRGAAPRATSPSNPTGLMGIDFVEVASRDPDALHRLLLAFGFSRVMRHGEKAIDLYRQGDITFLLNREKGSFAARFSGQHGPAITSMGWRFEDPAAAAREAVARGARPYADGDLGRGGHTLPAIFGIGDSLLYFVDGYACPSAFGRVGLRRLDAPEPGGPDKGFLAIDHLTNNVHKGTMATWGRSTRTCSASPRCGTSTSAAPRRADLLRAALALRQLLHPDQRGHREAKSQINEYLDEYKGPGVQHLAFLTADMLASLDALDGTPIEFLDIDADYYASVFDRVPNVTEDHAEIRGATCWSTATTRATCSRSSRRT
jgi:4-hydroxyphenylpyruvate dioxygenase